MKRIFTLLLTVMVIGSCALAAGGPVRKSQLPKPAQNFISDYWPRVDMLDAYREAGNYEVTLDGGTTLLFDRKGNWIEIENAYGFPTHFLPDGIGEFIHRQYPDSYIARVKRNERGFTVTLNSGLELCYDTQGNIIRVND